MGNLLEALEAETKYNEGEPCCDEPGTMDCCSNESNYSNTGITYRVYTCDSCDCELELDRWAYICTGCQKVIDKKDLMTTV